MSTEYAHRIAHVSGTMKRSNARADGLFASQTWTAKRWRGNMSVEVELRFDDGCRNGHMTFAITGMVYEGSKIAGGGCIHDTIREWFPELASLIKWHLTSTDGPMHYVENTVYHADGHGPTHAWVYFKGATASDPLQIGDDGVNERLLTYAKASIAKRAERVGGYRVEWDEKTIKARNLEHARSSAVWPEATDEQLCAEPAALTAMLQARLPQLLAEFKSAMVDTCGFEWREVTK